MVHNLNNNKFKFESTATPQQYGNLQENTNRKAKEKN